MKTLVGISILLAVILMGHAVLAADQKKAGPDQLFYNANQAYAKRDYVKAVEDYAAILDMGLENGNLYYNIGNGFLKLGKVGYAVLCYEKAKRLIPQDSDLKANLAYAMSLSEATYMNIPEENFILKGIKKVFGDLSLSMIALSALILYLSVIVIGSFLMLSPAVRRFKIIYYLVILAFLTTLIGFGVRYYDEVILKHGIVVQKDVECKYEPIDKSTTYYKLNEAEKVLILKTRDGWRQIKRPDGKIGWVKKEAVEEI
ncbi:MAG: hypothetical protein NC938_00055 [Candidatus Omnitrophica bacterium]|nr:hypothetical protein [Candidatus Omnitrophota bacterium]MCM8790083.1 hypothetical protein [Candidatus Omnitrophota bacterium]